MIMTSKLVGAGALRSSWRFWSRTAAHAPPRFAIRRAGSLVAAATAAAASAATSSPARLVCAAGADSFAMSTKPKAFADGEAETGRGSATTSVGPWYSVPELAVRDRHFVVPLDYSKPSESSISIFVREVVSVGKEEQKLPCLLFLQGGPGYESPRPADSGGWLKKACEEFRVILLDQRGTGKSTALSASALSQFPSAQQQASYLQHFRADNIVRDAEVVRGHLLPAGDRWTVLGQSFGGFCAVTYLSLAPNGLRQVLLTGGLPPLDDGCTAEMVYHQCYKRLALQNEKYYIRFPQDEEIVRSIIIHLAEAEGGGILLPSGSLLTPRGLQLLGMTGLGSVGGFERLHYILERAWDPILVPESKKRLSYTFLRMVENWLDFDTNPLYALLHEQIYCQGAASKWAAHRVREELGDKFDAVKAASSGQRVFFTGEMIYPWMFEDISALWPFKEAANILAEKDDWSPLYDKKALAINKVPVAAAVYYEDLYVNFQISEVSASLIAGIRVWVTNEYTHSGLREDGARILDHLFGLIKGKSPLR